MKKILSPDGKTGGKLVKGLFRMMYSENGDCVGHDIYLVDDSILTFNEFSNAFVGKFRKDSARSGEITRILNGTIDFNGPLFCRFWPVP
jgi:hypothetical protein